MTPIDLALEGIHLAVALAAFALIYAGPFRFARIANWRQDVFAVRNRLWDQMRRCGTLDEPAHRHLRDTMNAMIRRAPVMNLFYFWAVLRFVPTVPKDCPEPKFAELMSRVANSEARAALAEAAEVVVYLFYRQLFLNSFPGAVVGWPIWVAQRLGLFRAMERAARVKRRFRDRLGEYAEAFGQKARQGKLHTTGKPALC